MQDTSQERSFKLIHPQVEVRAECGVSEATWWRWKKFNIVPAPDVEIRGKYYYSDRKRKELIAALLGEEAVQ
ncbi:MAG: hypothetical protein CMK46_00745 [Porticoccus sp.]|nr:hypothetical protein [Porticoccus sp.]|tara:strand:- start:6474 stop:6689 length:216 start_codon:yes stop_codon:yes gene_type:complete